MKRNVGGFDLFRRVGVGVLFSLVGVAMLLESLIGVVPIAVGGFLLVTGVLRWCPINARLGYDTSSES